MSGEIFPVSKSVFLLQIKDKNQNHDNCGNKYSKCNTLVLF